MSVMRWMHLHSQVLQRARGVDNVEIELEDITEAARQSRMIKNPYMTILQRKYRPQFIIACIFMIFQQFDVSPSHSKGIGITGTVFLLLNLLDIFCEKHYGTRKRSL